jgi:hypothetical protein
MFPLIPFVRVSCPAVDTGRLSVVEPGVKALNVPLSGPPDTIDF